MKTLLFVSIICLGQQFSFALKNLKRQVATTTPTTVNTKATKSRLDKIFDTVFDDADVNNDGTVEFNEVYELVLQIYVKLNRQAPIPAPSRGKVQKIYRLSDKNKDNYLTRDEFRAFANKITGRALVRLTGYKIVTLIGAPLLAECLIRRLAGNQSLKDFAVGMVPAKFEERVFPIITSRAFWRTVLMILFVATLGNICLAVIDFFLDIMLKDKAIDEKEK
jgi:hypothetical protein